MEIYKKHLGTWLSPRRHSALITIAVNPGTAWEVSVLIERAK